MTKKKTTPKRYQQMNTRELAAATAKFDQEMIIDRCRELTADEEARWLRAR